MQKLISSAACASLLLTAVAGAQTTIVEGFDTDDAGFLAGPFPGTPNVVQTYETTGGNPGGWVRGSDAQNNPEWYGPNAAPFAGDLRAQGVTGVSADLRQDLEFGQFPVWLVLVSDPDPMVMFDEQLAATMANGGPLSPPTAAGWVNYTFDVPSSEVAPANWNTFGGTFDGIIQNVTSIQIHFANNPFFGFDLFPPPPGWDFGLDNFAITAATGDSFCFGDGGDQMGCTDCPCGNNAALGSGGGCMNSAGTSAVLAVTGSGSLTSADLCFSISGAKPNSFGVLTSGSSRAPANAANPCFGLDSGLSSSLLDGLRCVVQGVLRHGARPIDAMGNNTNPWGNCSANFPNSAFTAGQDRHFQVVYREDAGVVCATEQNTSQGLTISITN